MYYKRTDLSGAKFILALNCFRSAPGGLSCCFVHFSFPINYQLGAQLQGTLFMLYLIRKVTIHRKYNVNGAPLSAIHRKYNMNGAPWSRALPSLVLRLRAQEMFAEQVNE